MTTLNHCDELTARFSRMATGGLVDVKFFLDTSDEATQSVVCDEVNRLFAAVDANEHYVLDFKDASSQ
jgi:hypothetical protein